MIKCPISEELKKEVVGDIRKAMVEESISHYGTSVAYTINFDQYAEETFARLWEVVRKTYLDYCADLRRGIPRNEVVAIYQEGLTKILEAGGVTSVTIEKVFRVHTREA